MLRYVNLKIFKLDKPRWLPVAIFDLANITAVDLKLGFDGLDLTEAVL